MSSRKCAVRSGASLIFFLLLPGVAFAQPEAGAPLYLDSKQPIERRNQTFRDFAREAFLALNHPLGPVGVPQEPAIREVEDHSRAVWQDAVAGFLKQNGLEPAQLLQPPPPADETCRSYCPRCLAQFTTSTGVCEDCRGLPLVPFADPQLERR